VVSGTDYPTDGDRLIHTIEVLGKYNRGDKENEAYPRITEKAGDPPPQYGLQGRIASKGLLPLLILNFFAPPWHQKKPASMLVFFGLYKGGTGRAERPIGIR